MSFDLEKLRSVGHLKGGRTGSKAVSGREHPDSGLPYQVVTDEAGNKVTEHGQAGSGLSQRQDVQICAETVNVDLHLDG
jgi:hypothetical protein